MADSELVDLVRRSLSAEVRAAFERRVDEQAAALRRAIAAGRFDNDGFTVGLELEAYAVDDEGRLARVPEEVFETAACNKELGLHNVELNSPPDVFGARGIENQAAVIRERVAAARRALSAAGLELVLDGMWTIPPPEGSVVYLSDVEIRDGVTVAANMRASPRYSAIDNEVLSRTGGAIELDLPGAPRREFPTILVESLTSSIQPHLQIPDLDAFPAHYDVAVRTLGPVLALATNSPFLPADLYGAAHGADDSRSAPADPYEVVDRTPHELRIPVFEDAVNADTDGGKVRVPRDVERAADVVDRLVADPTYAPFLKEWVKDADAVDEYADRIWELDHKRGTYWRWLRTVIGGDPASGVGERSLRIEYRPLPTQPTVADVIACQCLVSGLVRGLVAADHPIESLEWEAARRSFYAAVEDGVEADLAWVDGDGNRTDDPDVVYAELFEYARRGLRDRGLSHETIDEYLAPVESRWEARTTPSAWKKRAVRERLDRGDDLRAAIEGMQREYVDRSRSGTPFAEW